MNKSFFVGEELHSYLQVHQRPLDNVEQSLVDATLALGGVSGMQIAPEQGRFMQLLVSVLGVESACEVGTFTGYSALQIARGMGPNGRLRCFDVSDEWVSVGRRHWEMADVAHKIDVTIAPALESLAVLDANERFDFVFIDADKTNYRGYYEALLPRLSERGVMLVDNTLWHGQVLTDESSDDSVAIRSFNDFVATDPRSESTILTIGDGLTFIRRSRD